MSLESQEAAPSPRALQERSMSPASTPAPPSKSVTIEVELARLNQEVLNFKGCRVDKRNDAVLLRELKAKVKKNKAMLETLAVQEGDGCAACFPAGGPMASIGGALRQQCLQTCRHPYFDQFIMVCILVNCVFLAVAGPGDDAQSPVEEASSIVFLYIFTVECACKLLALGHLYFEDYWNWLDLVVVLEGWVSSLVAGGSALSGLKTLRILRPLRVANRLPALKKIITAMLSSLPAIFDTFVVFFFFLLIFAMLCVMLWQGTFHYRCRDDVTGEWVDTDTLCFPPQEPSGFCATLQFLDQPYTCEEGETCQAWTSTPEGGSLNFDNLGWSFLTLFTVSTMENWANVLYYTQNVMAEGTFFVFLVIILVGNFTIVNLMIAAILVQLDGATQSETAEKLAKINEKHEDRKRKKTGSLLTESEWSKVALVPMASEAANSRPTSPAASTQPPNEVVPPGGSTDTQQRMMGDCLRVTLSSIDYVTRTCVVPYSYDGLSRAGGSWGARLRSEVIADECMFSNFIQACIVFNLVVLAMDAHNIDAGTNYFLETANLVLTYIFFAEMVAKLAVGGILDYVGSRWNLFDAFIVFGSILELSLESGAGGSSLYALRLVRMLRLTRVARLARLAHKWKSLQTVIKLIIKSSSGMGPVLLLLVLFMFIFSILSMQIFGSFEFDDDFVRFDNFYVAFVQCFFVILGEAWVDILYITIEGSGSVLSSLYFVAIIVVGSFLLINLILAVVLGDSMPNKVQQEVGLKQMVYIFDTADLRHALGLWGWQVEVGKRVAERELALNAWQRLGIKLGGINAALSLGHCVGVSTEHLFAIRAHLDAGTVARVKLAAHAERTNVGDPVEKKIQLSIGGAPSESVDDGAMEVEAYSASSTFERKLSSSICSSRFGEGMPDCSGLDEVTGLPIEYDRKSWTELHATAKVVESFATALGLGVTLTQELQWRRNKDTALPNETSVDVSLASGPQDPINIADGATLTRWKEHAKFGEHRDAVLDLVSGKHNDRFSLTLGGRLVLPLEVQDQLLFSDGEIEAVRARFGAACVVERERIAKQASKLARSFRSRSSPERRASLGPGADVAASNPGGEDVLRMVGFKELVQQLTKVTVNGSDLQRPSNADINIAFNLADVDKSGSIDEIEFLKIFQMVKEGRVTGLAGGNMFHRPSSDVEEQRAAFINMMGGESYRSSPRSLSDGSESKGTGSIVDGDVEAAEHNDPGVIRKSGDSHSSSQPNSFDLSSFIDVNKNKHHAARNRRPSIRHRIQAKLAFTKQKVRLDLRSNKVAPERGLHRRSYSGKFELTASGEIVSVQAKLSRWRRYRRWASAFKIQKWFHDLVLLCIAVSCIIMVASSEDEDYTSWLFLVDTACGLVFMVELVVNVGASKTRPYPPRWPHGRDGFAAFWEDPWNRLDLAIVVSQCLAPVFRETSITLGLAACTVVKSCRPLRIINRIKDLKSTVVLLYSSMMRLGTMVVFLSFAMTAYAVIGMQLFKGLYFYCEDPSELETNKSYMANVGPFPHGTSRYGTLSSDGVTYSARPCTGAYVNAAGLSVVAQGVWRNPDYHFDDFPNAFLSVFVMSTENWAELVWQGLSAQEVDISGVPYGNTNPIAIFFFAFGISFFSLYMFNLFIGVVFDQYIEMSAIAKIQSDGKLVRKEDREWETYRERLSEVKPYAAAFQPTSKWRRQCGRLAVHPKFTNAILCVIALNAAALAVTHRGQSADLTAITEASNVAFAAVFALEVFVKISGFGAQRYFEDSVNIFDFTVTAVSLLDSVLYLLSICLSFDSAALRFVRSMRVFRLMRLVNLAPGCRNVMLALHYALPRLVNVAQLLLITVFFFANFGWVCFRSFGEHGSRYANFSTVFSSMQLLFVLMTGDNYTDTLGELMAAEPQYKIGTVLFFLVYMVVQYFVVVNLFVMVVCEAFEVLSEENRTTVEHFLPEFCKAWAKLDPKGVGRIPLDKVEALIRSLPAPFGVPYAERGSRSSQESYSQARSFRRLRAKAHYLRQQPRFSGAFPEVLNGIVALWLLEVDKIRMPGAGEQVELLEASILITIRARAWCERRRKRLAAEAAAQAVAEAGSGAVLLGAATDPSKADSPKSAAHLLVAKGKTPSSRLGIPSRFTSTKVAPSPLSGTSAAMNSTGSGSSSLLGGDNSNASMDNSSSSAEAASGAAKAKGSKSREKLPPGWSKSYTSVYDTKFYYHAPSKTSSWEPPAKTPAKAAAAASLEAADETKNEESSL